VAIYDSLTRFIKSYLEKYYETNSVLNADVEIQMWAKNVQDKDIGGVTGFPDKFATVNDLASTLANVIMMVTAQHHVLNGASARDGQSFPILSRAFYKELPSKDSILYEDPRSFLATNVQMIHLDMVLLGAYRIPISTLATIGNSYGAELGVNAIAPLSILKSELSSLSSQIVAREALNPRPFFALNPSKIPYQVWY
jgi:arachidonate 15-lipoxygenase